MNFAPVHDGGTPADACEGRFDFSLYVAQVKVDGVRAMLDCDTGLMTGRNSPLGVFRGSLPAGAVLDGELSGNIFHALDALQGGMGAELDGEGMVARASAGTRENG
jgi:hypothetical protein